MSSHQHLIVLHRWTDAYADYASYLDHEANRVSYVTTAAAQASLPAAAASVEVVPSTEDRTAVRAAVARLVERHGHPARILALHEIDLDVAAELREQYGVPGDTPAQLHPFRDKLAMARVLGELGVPLPASAPAADRADVARFAQLHGWPVILKPVRGSASSNVRRLDGPGELAAYEFPDDGLPMMVQQYLPHEILHVDGVAADGDLRVWRASRYVNTTCLGFTAGDALGSVELDDPVLLKAVGEFTRRVVPAMNDKPWVFHLELFAEDCDGSDAGLLVLEVGARPGGAEVPFVWKEVHGIDLMEVAVAIQLGRPLPDFGDAADGADPAGTGEVGGWLLVPWPSALPCRVLASDSQLDASTYVELIPAPGDRIGAIAGYEHAGARFRFRGRSSAEVALTISRTIDRYDLRTEPLPHVILVNAGSPVYREYALEDAAAHGLVSTINHCAPPEWERSLLTHHRVIADTSDVDAVANAIGEIRAQAAADPRSAGAEVGVLTWVEALLECTAQAAERAGLAHMSPEAVRNCRDKLRTRRLLEKAGLPSAAYAVARGLDEATSAAERIGYPVIVKPRALAGSAGVVRADTTAELEALYRTAALASFPGLDPLDGVLIEEYLQGPEISVDSVVVDGEVHCLNLARKRVGFPPYFEEVGHLVSPWWEEPWAEGLVADLRRVHAALAVTTGLTHAELKLTPRGPRLIELNGRLGGDFIPLLGRLATGIDLTAAAIDAAIGRLPRIRPTSERCAEVRFIYPDRDGVVECLEVRGAREVPGVELVVALAKPGQQLHLPPKGVVPRLAAIIVTGEDEAACAAALDQAEHRIVYALSPASESV